MLFNLSKIILKRKENEDDNNCEILGIKSIILQVFLALASFSTLIIKRYFERPQRPWKIWFFDVSKQICSAGTQHFLNLLVSSFVSTKSESNDCKWYFINFLLDTTLGVLFCSILMKIINKFIDKKNIIILKSGNYFERIQMKNKIYYRLKIKMYFYQLLLWEIVIIINKALILTINFILKKLFENFSEFILSIFSANVELLMVMVVFPIIFNAIQFWIFDNLLKLNLKKNSKFLNKIIQSNLEFQKDLEGIKEGTDFIVIVDDEYLQKEIEKEEENNNNNNNDKYNNSNFDNENNNIKKKLIDEENNNDFGNLINENYVKIEKE